LLIVLPRKTAASSASQTSAGGNSNSSKTNALFPLIKIMAIV
jgi:hypothetical protein